MNASRAVSPACVQSTDGGLDLSGSWLARDLGKVQQQLDAVAVPGTALVIDGTRVDALDTAGAWVLQRMLLRLRGDGVDVRIRDLRPELAWRLAAVAQPAGVTRASPAPGATVVPPLQVLGAGVAGLFLELLALLSFVGASAVALAGSMFHPARWRWRPVLFNIRRTGFDALPMVGLLSFMLGIVVAYQGADQLRRYGANIFVADLVGLSMLREFAPLITAIIIAGRSGSAFSAQIGTMAVTEEIDAMRTLGIPPLDVLVLPKVIALVIALPLLTVFADVLGVCGGMIMAQVQLGVGYGEFIERFLKAVSVTAYLVGIGKAPVFAFIIAMVGCFQGFRTRGGADAVGRQTTRSVVQSIFLVILADGLFSIAFSALDL